MKTHKKIALTGALTLALGTAAILGNSALAARVMQKGIQTEYSANTEEVKTVTAPERERSTGRVSTIKDIDGTDGTQSTLIQFTKDENSVNASEIVEGEPTANEIQQDKASDIALKQLTDKYALKTEILEKFNVEERFFSTYEDGLSRVWWVNLYPKNTDDFTQLGCYTAIIDAKTGNVLKTLTVADGKG